jgi:branched-chain amino acid transport system substrate-binding protein
LTYQVDLVSYDDQNIANTAVNNAQQIIADREILCGVGHYDSDITVTASDIYHQGGLAFVSSAATAPLLTDRNYLEANRVIGRADGQGLVAAQFAQAQGFRSVFIVSQQAEVSVRNAESFRTTSGNLGIRWLGSSITNITDDNRSKIVNEILEASPELIYVSTAPDQAFPFLTALRAAGYTGTILGTESLHDQALIDQAGASLLDGGGLYYTIMSPPAQYHPHGAEFVEAFTSRYGEPPGVYAARAYDAAGMCLAAIERAATEKAGALPTRNEVARALRRLNDYDGITGTYDFNRQGDPDPVSYYIYQVTSTDAASWDQNPIVSAYEIVPP